MPASEYLQSCIRNMLIPSEEAIEILHAVTSFYATWLPQCKPVYSFTKNLKELTYANFFN